MKLPPKKKPGDAVLAADWNLLMDAVASRTPRPGRGLELITAGGGFAYSAPPPTSTPMGGLPPFAVIAIENNTDEIFLTMRQGWVIERPPAGADVPPVRFWMPKYGSDQLDAIPRPRIPVTDGCTVYCKFRTNDAGTITETPEIVVESSPPQGTGQGDYYYVKLLGFSLDSDGIPQVAVYQQSDIEHWAKLAKLPFLVTLGDTTFNVETGWVAKRKYSGEGSHLEFIEAAALVNKPLTTCEVWCEVQAGYDDVPTSATIDTGATVPDSIQATPDSPGYYYYRLARITVGSTGASVETIHVGGSILHTPHQPTEDLHPWQVTLSADKTGFSVRPGWVAVRRAAGTAGSDITYFSAAGLSQTAGGPTTVVYCEVQTGTDDIPTLVQIAAGPELPESIQSTPSSNGYYYYHLATVTAAGDPLLCTGIETVHVGGTIFHEIADTAETPHPFQVTISANGASYSVQTGWVATRKETGAEGSHLEYFEAAGLANQAITGATTVIYCTVETGADDIPSLVQIDTGATLPESVQATPTSGGYYYHHLATISAGGEPLAATGVETVHLGGTIIHIPMIPPAGLTGYITLTRHVWQNMPHIARLFVRMVNGRQTETLDEYDDGVTSPPAEWGTQLYEISFASTGPVGAATLGF